MKLVVVNITVQIDSLERGRRTRDVLTLRKSRLDFRSVESSQNPISPVNVVPGDPAGTSSRPIQPASGARTMIGMLSRGSIRHLAADLSPEVSFIFQVHVSPASLNSPIVVFERRRCSGHVLTHSRPHTGRSEAPATCLTCEPLAAHWSAGSDAETRERHRNLPSFEKPSPRLREHRATENILLSPTSGRVSTVQIIRYSNVVRTAYFCCADEANCRPGNLPGSGTV
ncbi:hypothetical protein GQ607_001268 [Colletotrichum asianum]|uniref:Uncharacterized protein n=1 Tax=Colletotrichum asianum TaxID=702518 RepID=A0A8H3ZX23_9PEZI|nr:hypothetical protein GQ607_001268 [Colletotrichum asianum]